MPQGLWIQISGLLIALNEHSDQEVPAAYAYLIELKLLIS